ncbi:response regulator [Christiangramia crocea]|uniref:Response regulator n=1 Tax=Christiangramia crocea TaxID=2904124 RepID=A0A9X1UVG5_9FLAO|nr:response regulator [Gramella crocea]MCG9971152.1 response regulator [Gramella crocea]
MIYLIDDKKLRQENDYGWNLQKLKKYEHIIQPIYDLKELSKRRKEIFRDNNIILYHESFLDHTNLKLEASVKRSDLDEFSSKQKNWLAFFSGSKNSRNIENNVAHLPVSTLYQNLETFIQKYLQGDLQLNYLLFGENPDVEQELVGKLESSLHLTEEEPSAKIVSSKILFFRPAKLNISNPIENAKETVLFNDVSDEKLSQKIVKELTEEKYDIIFLPLCFGPTLSDYNGLRLATHIRCTNTPNKVSSIFIYSPINIEELIKNQYFDILKTKNVEIVDFKKKAFEIAANKKRPAITNGELPNELKKIKLEPPKNYEDNHSIANEWAIYRWSSALKANDDDIEIITDKVQHHLYFKFLKTIYPVKDLFTIPEANLKIKPSLSPKILYIDDEANKGWYEIFCKIFYDENRLEFHYLDDELNFLTREEIIEKSLATIGDKNIDIVLLDFRLHPDDFRAKSIEEVTGLKLLKAIKASNPGIQVIIFSATNKIWNLQALEKAGSDGFLIKESPENSIDPEFTSGAINGMIEILTKRAELIFLKQFYENYRILEKELLPRKEYKKVPNPLPKEFVDEVLKWFKLSIDILKNGNTNDSKKTSSFLFMFSVLENLANRVINVDNPIKTENGKKGRKVYKFEYRGTDKSLKFFTEDKNRPGYYRKTNSILKCGRNIPWHLKILNTIDHITNETLTEEELSNIVKKRNDFIHSNTTTGEKFIIVNDDLIWLHQVIYNGLKNVI